MRRPDRSFRPGATQLESRALLSTAGAGPVAEVALLSASRSSSSRRGLSGSLSGQYRAESQDNRPADAPLPIRLNTTGNVAGLGRMTLAGTLDFGGFRMANTPDISGRLTLSNAKGSITLQVSGHGGNGPVAGKTFRLNASVVNGTGDYANLRALGTLTLKLGANGSRPGAPIGGGATATLNLSPPRR